MNEIKAPLWGEQNVIEWTSHPVFLISYFCFSPHHRSYIADIIEHNNITKRINTNIKIISNPFKGVVHLLPQN